MTPSCPTCRAEVPEGARFCPSCGAALAVDAGLTTERKVVTTLFADLVGFTALSERRDPEDVDAALRAYFDLARGAIEHFGGVVEKFIGDAVVGLFGAPTAREDDAERAVRAALQILAGMQTLPPLGEEHLQVRAAVNTGPALVRLLAVPGAGEGVLVGDAINTASRLLETAPPMSVVVGERTHALTTRMIAYRPLGHHSVRGKQRPVETWLAVSPLARRGVDLNHAYATPMVGREVESGILRGMFARACASSRPQLALVAGEAGVGKSRLIFEFARWVDDEPDLLINWRQGRCLPYGEGSGFQPLAEIVCTHAGVTEMDDGDAMAAKLDRAVPDGPDHDWLVDRLRPLVGLPARPAEQDENFRAWALFLDRVARERPTVVFFDDLHWADDGFLAFLDHLVKHASGAPLMVLGACRPDLFELHADIPGYLGPAIGDDAPVVRIDLASLSVPETERLVGELSPDVPTEVRTVIVDRSGGNPFYTEELVRLLHTSGRRAADEWPAFESLPDSLQVLLTARLDALDPDHKAVLADAAVAGQVFSPELVAAMGSREPDDVRRMLAELTVREFVRPAPDDRPAEDGRFTFWHAMTRDAAYSQLPRGARAEKHAAAARWLERRMGDGPDDSVEAIAHHYVAAFDLLTEMDDGATAELRPPAAAALARAGDAAAQLDAEMATRHYARALDLMATAPERLAVQVKLAPLLSDRGHLEDARSILENAVEEARAAGDRLHTAVGLSQLARVCLREADPRALALAAEAAELLTPADVSPEAIIVLEQLAMLRLQKADMQAVIALTDQIADLCMILHIPLPHMALGLRGFARFGTGRQREGVQDLLESVRSAERAGPSTDVARLLDAAAMLITIVEGAASSAALRRQGIETARRQHDEGSALTLMIGLVENLIVAGDWESALAMGEELEREDERRGLAYRAG